MIFLYSVLAAMARAITWSNEAECSTVDFTDWQLLLLLLFTGRHGDRYLDNVVVEQQNDCRHALQNNITRISSGITVHQDAVLVFSSINWLINLIAN